MRFDLTQRPSLDDRPSLQYRIDVLGNLRRKVLFGLVLGLAITLALGVYADFSKVISSLAGFPWHYLPIILGLTLLNYLLRFIKWEIYLRLIGVRSLSRRDSAIVFLSGFSMVLTPGKVGEWLKCYLLLQLTGTPFSRSAPIIVAERLTDGIAMVLLASGGLVLFRMGWQVLAAVAFLAICVVAAARYRPLINFTLSIAARLPFVSGYLSHLTEFMESAWVLLSPRSLALGVALGFMSWGSECLAFYLILLGLGVEPSGILLVQATFILAASTLGGAMFLTPGGLGVAEGGITGLSQILIGMFKETAVAGAILIRLSTLWFGVTLGMISLFLLTRKAGIKISDPEAARSARELGDPVV